MRNVIGFSAGKGKYRPFSTLHRGNNRSSLSTFSQSFKAQAPPLAASRSTNILSRLGPRTMLSHTGYRKPVSSTYEDMCSRLQRMARFDKLSLPPVSSKITVESLRAKRHCLSSKDIEHLVLLLKDQAETLRNDELTLGPENAPMMDLISTSGTCFPVEVKTTFSTGTEFPTVPVNQTAVRLMREKRMHPHGLVVAVNSRTLEFWIFKANENVHVSGTTTEVVPRCLVVPTDKPLETGRFVL